MNAQVRDKTTRAAGVFAEATYPVADAWRVIAGVRYDHTNVSIVEDYTSINGVTQNLSGEAGTRRFDNVTYKARLEHDLTAQNMLYASVSTGFSPGDVSVTTGPSGNSYALELAAETLTVTSTLGGSFASLRTGARSPGYHLYYPRRRQTAAAFAIFVEALRYRPPAASARRSRGQ